MNSSAGRLHFVINNQQLFSLFFQQTHKMHANLGELLSLATSTGDQQLVLNPLPYAANRRAANGFVPTARQELAMDIGNRGTNWLGFARQKLATTINRPTPLVQGLTGVNISQNPDDNLYRAYNMGKYLDYVGGPRIGRTDTANPYLRKSMNPMGATANQFELLASGAAKPLPLSNMNIDEVNFNARHELGNKYKEFTNKWAQEQLDPQMVRAHAQTNTMRKMAASKKDRYQNNKDASVLGMAGAAANDVLVKNIHGMKGKGAIAEAQRMTDLEHKATASSVIQGDPMARDASVGAPSQFNDYSGGPAGTRKDGAPDIDGRDGGNFYKKGNNKRDRQEAQLLEMDLLGMNEAPTSKNYSNELFANPRVPMNIADELKQRFAGGGIGLKRTIPNPVVNKLPQQETTFMAQLTAELDKRNKRQRNDDGLNNMSTNDQATAESLGDHFAGGTHMTGRGLSDVAGVHAPSIGSPTYADVYSGPSSTIRGVNPLPQSARVTDEDGYDDYVDLLGDDESFDLLGDSTLPVRLLPADQGDLEEEADDNVVFVSPPRNRSGPRGRPNV